MYCKQWLTGCLCLLTVNEYECDPWNLPGDPLPVDDPPPDHLPVAVGLPPLLNPEKGRRGKKCALHTRSSSFEVFTTSIFPQFRTRPTSAATLVVVAVAAAAAEMLHIIKPGSSKGTAINAQSDIWKLRAARWL